MSWRVIDDQTTWCPYRKSLSSTTRSNLSHDIPLPEVGYHMLHVSVYYWQCTIIQGSSLLWFWTLLFTITLTGTNRGVWVNLLNTKDRDFDTHSFWVFKTWSLSLTKVASCVVLIVIDLRLTMDQWNSRTYTLQGIYPTQDSTPSKETDSSYGSLLGADTRKSSVLRTVDSFTHRSRTSPLTGCWCRRWCQVRNVTTRRMPKIPVKWGRLLSKES